MVHSRGFEELADRIVGLLRTLDLRHVSAVELDMARLREGVGDVSGEGDRHEPVATAPYEERLCLKSRQP